MREPDGVLRAVILDYTGVITVPLGFTPASHGGGAAPAPAADGAFDPSLMGALMASELRNDDPDGMWNRLERGEIAMGAVADHLDALLPGAGAFLQTMAGTLMTRLDLRPDVLAAVARWREAGLRTAVLTNNVVEWRPMWHAKLHEADAFDLFDAIVDSSEVGMRKPEARIYLHAADVLGVRPEECVFVDDFEHNVHGAAAVGMRAILATAADLHLAEIDALVTAR